ncbi:helix-turn-helix domain-containing protein [Dyadobacter tibetensis]|uniref:helix-turn-helix domain-containing protein n=1 Tax=Dyadobacter tibetensis TaxID=1211851 RepID=UPI000471943B|nr:helix-turn-helix domain-containing protein [Dyadobacter tibetensis]
MSIRYWTMKPSVTTQNYVRFYWFLEGDEPYTHHSMADVCPELVFHYHGRFSEVFANGHREHSFLAGINAPSTQTRQFSIDQGFGMFGVYLYPHAIPMLFDIQTKELTNQTLDLDSFTKQYGSDLEEKIMLSKTNVERVNLMESFIVQRIHQQKETRLPVFQALQFIINAEVAPTVKALTQNYFISERQLERQFQRFTGFTPKQFIRIARFQHTMQFYGSQELRLTDVALNCGYYDQSHFINDFKQFSGLNPKEYFKGKTIATLWRDAETD